MQNAQRSLKVLVVGIVGLVLLSTKAPAQIRHHWLLDEAEGLVAADSFGGSDAALVNFEQNDDSQWVEGEFGNALNLGADATVNNHLEASVPAMSAAVTGGFTIALWVKPGFAILNPGEYQLFQATNDWVGFTIMNAVSQGRTYDRVLLFWDANAPNIVTSTTSLEPEVWYHVAITSTGAGGERQIYIDGAAEEKRFWLDGGADVGTSDGWLAGIARIGGTAGGRWHDSVIDDVRVYEKALSQAEIEEIIANPPKGYLRITGLVPEPAQMFHDAAKGIEFTVSTPNAGATIDPASIRLSLDGVDVSGDLVVTGSADARKATYGKLVAEHVYSAEITASDTVGGTGRKAFAFGTLEQSSEPGLRHHWKLDENVGLTAVDSASGNHCALIGFADPQGPQWIAGTEDGALDLSATLGVPGYLEGSIPALSASLTLGCTVALWVRPGSAILNAGEYQLFSSPGDGVGLTILNLVVGGQLFERNLLFWDGLYNNIVLGSTTIEPGQWHHVAITSTGIGGERKIYLDGRPEEKKLLVATGQDVGTADGWPEGAVNIGGYHGSRLHDSAIDDVRIYERVLSDAEIADLVPSLPPGPLELSDLVPQPGDNFHDPAADLSFKVSTSNPGATIAPSAIRLELNGTDVSQDLAIGGSATVREVSYTKLAKDLVYDARLEAEDGVGGKILRRWTFGTLTRSAELGLRHHWKLDESGGLIAADSANGANGLLMGFEAGDDSQWVEGMIEGALNLAADATIDNHVEASVPAMSALETGGFTIALWVRPGFAILNPGEYQLFDATNDAVGFTIMNGMSEGRTYDRVLLFWDMNAPNIVTSTTSLEPEVWYHVAITSTGAGGERQIYIDGVSEEKRFWMEAGADVGTSDGWPAGIARIGGLPGRWHDSVIDDVRVYEEALDAERIADLATIGPPLRVFHRGDPNNDGSVNITDGIYVLNFLFLGGPAPTCLESANPNDDASINITDGIYILNYLFLGGPAPVAPGSVGNPCGPDRAGSPTDLGCAVYTHC
jgi:hypothetical protein